MNIHYKRKNPQGARWLVPMYLYGSYNPWKRLFAIGFCPKRYSGFHSASWASPPTDPRPRAKSGMI